MKNKLEVEENVHNHDLEILRAVAQAWYGHSGSSRTTSNEFDALRLHFKRKPTRFKLEAMKKPKDMTVPNHKVRWDFGQSLLDSYEIVSLSKRIETGLVMDHDQLAELESSRLSRKRRKESNNSLRKLFGRMSSGRFSDAEVPQEETT
ncbi:hypothetical protein RHSIM_Rhsim08G0177900 [Rhododendron simsii]|uniref:Uncharacterized protein n=1 Tax=Rhododendron simsii TaxID=118357 RepID=A0A834LIE5_RHOSS|nr:hypothetical protein RHSIM_Rhsim08G0177900 [Rhododendron simsii]